MAQGIKNAWGETVIQGRLIGRNNVVIPPSQVEDLAQLGCTNKEIANFFGVTEMALARNFEVELMTGRELVKQKLRRAMLQNACVHMSAAVQIFLAKNMLGMADTPQAVGTEVLPWNDDAEREEFVEDLQEELNNIDNAAE